MSKIPMLGLPRVDKCCEIKILAGKTVEDIKREAAREKALLEKMAQMPSHHGSNPISLNKSGSFSYGSAVPDRERMRSDFMKQQQGGQGRGYMVQSSSPRPLHIDHRAHLQNQFHLRINIPTYLDDFRHGFPRKGLPTVSAKWWGNTVPCERDNEGAEENAPDNLSSGQLDDGTDELASGQQNEKSSNASFRETSRDANNKDDLMPASILTRTRKSAVTNGRKALGIAVTRGYGAYRLREKDEALLRNVFEDSLPSLWRASLPT